jgi:hypothetical protein
MRPSTAPLGPFARRTIFSAEIPIPNCDSGLSFRFLSLTIKS